MREFVQMSKWRADGTTVYILDETAEPVYVRGSALYPNKYDFQVYKHGTDIRRAQRLAETIADLLNENEVDV